MPYAPKRPCTQPGCPELVDSGRCERHQRKQWRHYEHQRGSSAKRGYGARWQRLREIILSRDNYICAECGSMATDVDHILPKSRGGTDDPANLQSLCHGCHSRKTVSENR